MSGTAQFIYNDYTFNAAAKTITFNALGSLDLSYLQAITNATTGTIIFQYTNPVLGGAISGNVLTLAYDTTTMSDADTLTIIMNAPSTAPVGSVDNPTHVDGSAVTQPVSIASNVSTNLFDSTAQGLTSHAGGSNRGLDTYILDTDGNPITSFGGGFQVLNGATADFGTDLAGLMAYNNAGTYDIVGTSQPLPTGLYGPNDSSGIVPTTVYSVGSQVISPASPLNMFKWRDVGGGSDYAIPATLAQLSGGTVGAQHVAVVNTSGTQIDNFGGSQFTAGQDTSGIEKSNLVSYLDGTYNRIVSYDNPFPTDLELMDTDSILRRVNSVPAGSLWAQGVGILASDGTRIDSFGGGTQYEDGFSLPDSATGTACFWQDGSSMRVASDANPLPGSDHWYDNSLSQWVKTTQSSPTPQIIYNQDGNYAAVVTGNPSDGTYGLVVQSKNYISDGEGGWVPQTASSGGGGGIQYNGSDAISGTLTGTASAWSDGTVWNITSNGAPSPEKPMLLSDVSSVTGYRPTTGMYLNNTLSSGDYMIAQMAALMDDTGLQTGTQSNPLPARNYVNTVSDGFQLQGGIYVSAAGAASFTQIVDASGADRSPFGYRDGYSNDGEPLRGTPAAYQENIAGTYYSHTVSLDTPLPVQNYIGTLPLTEGGWGNSMAFQKASGGDIVVTTEDNPFPVKMHARASDGEGGYVDTIPLTTSNGTMLTRLIGTTYMAEVKTDLTSESLPQAGLVVHCIMYGSNAGSLVPIAVNSSGEIIIAS